MPVSERHVQVALDRLLRLLNLHALAGLHSVPARSGGAAAPGRLVDGGLRSVEEGKRWDWLCCGLRQGGLRFRPFVLQSLLGSEPRWGKGELRGRRHK